MEDRDAVTRIGVGSTVVIAGFLVGALFHYVIKIILARFLGPEPYGVFVQGLAIAQAVTSISLFGLHMSIPRFISFYKGRKESELMEETVSTAFYLVLPVTVLGASALFLSAEWISLMVFSEPALVQPLKLFSVTVIPLGAIYILISLFRGLQNARYKVYLDDIVFSGLVMVLLVFFYLVGLNVERAVYAYIAAELITVGVGYYLFRKLYDRKILTGGKKVSRRLVKFSWPLFVISVLLMVNRWVDVVMIGWLMESASVGIYNVAYSIAGLLAFLLSSLSYFFMPVVSELYGEGRVSEILGIYEVCVRWVVMTSAPLLVGILIFPVDILVLLFGSSYIPAALPLMVLGVGFFSKIATGPSGITLLSMGKPRLQMLGIGAVTAVTVVLNLLLIPRLGITGAAVSTLLGFLTGHLLLLFMAGREMGGLPYNRRMLKIVLAVLAAALPVYGLKLLLEPEPVLSFFLGVVLLAVYGLTLLLLDGFSEEDREIFRELVGFVR